MRKKPSFFLFPRWELTIPTLGTFYSHVGNNKSYVNLACMLRVCCVYVEAPIVYVGVCCVYVENTHFPRIYRRFQQNPCMLRQFLYSELEKDRFCMAKPMVSDSNTYGFRRQNLWF